ncbi:MAG: hypothetical protein IJA10_12420 [Lachnospiraceae bacterium]|nr:hypothetical protein [Lachnospiraceae bacterium]
MAEIGLVKKRIRKDVVVNTVKIAGAAMIAIFIAMAMEAEFAVSAGVVAILTIQPTKKETIKIALGRFIAFITALFIAYVSFSLFGYTIKAFMIYLILFVFVCQIFRWYSAMAMNSVLISHFLTFGIMNGETLKNEMILFCIGVGIGIIANLHLRKNTNDMEKLREETDTQIKKILSRMSERILDRDISDYNGDCFLILGNSIRKAKNVAEENFNNQFGYKDVYDREYIAMREKQCEVLYEMYKNVRIIETTPITAGKISAFLKQMAEVYHKNNTGKELFIQFIELDEDMKHHPLPVERKEFEDRAKLYGLLRHMEEFIKLKIEFAEKFEVES